MTGSERNALRWDLGVIKTNVTRAVTGINPDPSHFRPERLSMDDRKRYGEEAILRIDKMIEELEA